MNRLTITLPDDLYAMARAHAVASNISISKAIGDLLRQGRGASLSNTSMRRADSQPFFLHPLSGFPTVQGKRIPLTSEDVQRAEDDEDIRQLEMMGLNMEETQQGLAR